MNVAVRTSALAFGLTLARAVSGTAQDPITPPPELKYEIHLEKSIMVEMRDGIRLSTDLLFPSGAQEPLPVILRRTPYSKSPFRDNERVRFWVGQGYVYAVQDKRGKYESEGDYAISIGDAEDGYDTVDWLAEQPWSNGKVGTIGCSYNGDVQMFLATQRNPHHAAMVPQATGSSNGAAGGRYRQFASRYGGNIGLASAFGWFRRYGSKVSYRPPPPHFPSLYQSKIADYFRPGPTLPDVDVEEIWWSLPVVDMMKKAGAPPSDWETIVSVEPNDPWWDQFAYLTDDDRFDVPALFINSWYDFGAAESIYQYQLFRRNSVSERAQESQFIVISPMPHCREERATEHTMVGARYVGDARFDYLKLYLRWFDYWLKGIGQAPVRLNFWVDGFLLNRMQKALLSEAINLVERGVASVDAVDSVIRDGLGLRWALMGPFGVAETNADGGTREYLTRFRANHVRVSKDLGPPPNFDDEQIERVGRGTDEMLKGAQHDALSRWRDRMIRKICALKKGDPQP